MTSRPNAPTIDIVVEIPRGSRNKYEMDKDLGVIRLDRRLFSRPSTPRTTASCPRRSPRTATRSTRWCGGAHDAWVEIEASRARHTP